MIHRSAMSKTVMIMFCIGVIILTGSPGWSRSPIPEDAVLEHLESGFQLCEGPFWHPEGYLLFSDVWSSIIYKWTEDKGLVTFLSPSGQTNGMTMDLEGNLLVAQHQARQISRIEKDGTITPIATHYNNKRFHSPNDLVVKSDGAIFFTDPPWGGNSPEMAWHGVYRIPPNSDKAQLLVKDISYPNGLAFSPGESKLYVDDSNGKHVFVFDVIDDSTLANKRIFANLSGSQAADGMKVDQEGNLWVTGSAGVVVYSPEGFVLDSIAIDGDVTNLNWGGENSKILYICGFNDLYRIDLSGQTDLIPTSPALPKGIKLNHNFPNPFNPSTNIQFDLPEATSVKLSIYNACGQTLDVLLEQKLTAGLHAQQFDATSLNSGHYFYELLTGNERFVGKMQLVK